MEDTEKKIGKKPRGNGNGKAQIEAADQEEGNTEVLHNLKDLPKAWSSDPVPEPKLELPNPSSIAPEEMPGQVEKIVRDQEEIRGWITRLLKRIDERSEEVDKQKDPRSKKIAQRLADPGNKLDQETIDSYLHGGKDPFHIEAALTAVFEYYFTKPHKTPAEIQTTIKNLVEKGYLIEDPAGQLSAFEKAYNTNPAIGDETDTVRKGLKNLISNVLEIEKKSLSARATLTTADFLAGKKGTLILTIHAEEVKDQDGKTKFWRKGGDLLVESDGRKVWPIAVSGGIEKTIREGMAMKAWFFLDTLSNKKAPRSGISDDEIRKIQSLWYIVKRGLLRHKFAARATINRNEFFLENQPGICYLEYEGTWDVPDNGPRLANFFFLVRREDKEGVKRIHLEDTPDHLKDFFAECMGDYPEEREKFGDVPQPLRAVLQAGFRQTQEAKRKSAQIIG